MKSPLSRFKGKIRVRLFASITIILILFIVIISTCAYPILFRVFTASTYNNLKATAEKAETQSPGSESYYFNIYTLAQSNNVEIEIVDKSENLVYRSSGAGSATGSEHFGQTGSSTSEYSEMQESTKAYNLRNFDGLEVKRKIASNSDYFVYHITLRTGDTLYVFAPVADVENVVETADKVYSLISIVTIVLIGAIFFTISSNFLKPIEDINDVTKDMAALTFDRKCENYGSNEIGELGRNINILSDTLDKTLVDLKGKNDQLEKDIELRLALDNARKSFISNVSHELKTPLAIISGYAEGLCAGISDDPAVVSEYCNIIHEESGKMNELVLELLELSKLESKTAPFRPDYCDIGESVTSVIDHLSLQMQKNGITIENKVPLSLECYAEQDKIEIVLKNYITNAISHCGGESKKITVTSEIDNQCIKISVFNTGEHISEEDIPELWESFYRADKSHKRSGNRFGLGLSIVKGIMENHRCSCGVENSDGGVTFSFEVPVNSEYYENKEQ